MLKLFVKNKSIVANMSKHVVKLALCLPMWQKTTFNLHFSKDDTTRRQIDIMFANVSEDDVKFIFCS